MWRSIILLFSPVFINCSIEIALNNKNSNLISSSPFSIYPQPRYFIRKKLIFDKDIDPDTTLRGLTEMDKQQRINEIGQLVTDYLYHGGCCEKTVTFILFNSIRRGLQAMIAIMLWRNYQYEERRSCV